MKTDSFTNALVQEIIEEGVEESLEKPPPGTLCIETDRRLVYPSFQFASRNPHKLHGVIFKITKLLDGQEDALGAISWWLTPNAWLARTTDEAVKPADLLGLKRDDEIIFAAEQTKNDNY